MFASKRVATALPAQDMERVKSFYKEKFDLSPTREDPGGVWYECGEGTGFFVFPSMGQSKGDFTQMGWEVDDLNAAVKELADRGIEFERYDFPELKTDANGIAEIEGERSAWFKDSEGNLISIAEMTP